MPRGVKKVVSFEELIAAKNAEIADLEEKLKTAKLDLKNLNEAKEEAELKELYSIIKASGKTIDDVKALLQ